eukprot:maker-scaffold79_size400133-snap-gene-3.18 protein:Tk03963 transcript:maker-scaffold79_size400133-snap-gene-3.18-mRNA-1 annotation:"neural cell adhesion molecule 1 isoform x1"
MIVAQTGDSVTLACQVTRGNPQPEVKWHRRERKMPSGEEFIRGLSFTYTSVSRHHSGNYICSADNGFGEPSETLLKLDVQHPPEIDQDETFIHTGEGYETEIVCVIHSSPKAEVTWFKDGFPIDTSTNVISHRGNRHTLLIPSVSESSFGDYMCKAANVHGESEKSTRVSGYTLPNLRPATVYMTRVASKNSYGFNDYGEIFKFATKGADPVQKPMTGGVSSRVESWSVLTLLSIILVHLGSSR